MALAAADLARLGQMIGETHKDASDRMLDDDAIQTLADDVAQVPDSSDVAPSGSGYVDTYDLHRAAAEGWRVKAGMIAEGYNIKVEGAAFNRSEAYDHYVSESMRFAGMAQYLTIDTGQDRS